MKRFLKIFVSITLISSSFSYGARPSYTPPNAEGSDQNGLPQDENWPDLSKVESILENPPLPQDPFHLVAQDLIVNGQSYPLYGLGDSPLNIRYDKLEYAIEGKDFSVIGTFRGQETIRHTFKDIKIHSFTSDTEVLFAATTEGQLHAIDMVFLKKNIFRGPIPVYKNLISDESLKKPMSMNFWTRGLPPALVKNLVDAPHALFPHDRNGQIIFSAGDLILHRGPKGRSHAFAILSREVLAKNMEEKTEELTLRASVTSSEVFENMDPELLKELEAKIEMQITADDLSQLALRAIPSESIIRLLTQAEKLSDGNRLYDRSSLEEWKGSYSILMKEAVKNNKTLSPNGDLSSDWQSLMASAMNKGKPLLQKPGFFKKYALTLAAISGTTTALGIAYLTDVQAVMSALDYIYAHAIPPIVKVAEYRYPLMASVLSILSIIPLVQSVAWLHPSMMKTVAGGLKVVSRNLSDKIWNLSLQWQSLNVWQRLVTMGARVYSLISVAVWNHLGTLLRQPQLFRSLKLGLNPFEKVKQSSELGQALNLEKDLSVGTNNPFLDKKDLDQNSIKQQQAMQYLTQENLKARHVAFQLVALTLYQKQEVDPATLALLMQNDSNSEVLDASLFRDLTPQKQKEWLALTEVIANEWLQTARTEGQLFSSIPAEEFLLVYESAREKLARYKNSSVIKKRLLVFKDQANRFLKKLRQDTLLLGVSDARLLRTVYADPSVADQVKKTFVSDHILVAGLPAFWGDRANPEKANIPGGNADGSDRNLLTFRPTDGSLANFWTNPEHMMDVWINVTAHFFGGAARQILLYQGEPPVEETNYRPVEQILIDQTQEKEGLMRASSQWMVNALDTRKSALGNFYLKTLVRQLRTIQAGLMLSLTFRFIATNPTFEHALMGWYLFFVAGTWSYAWPWTIIGQGNNLEEKRLKANADRLLELQTRLSQALRLKDENAIIETSQQLKSLYSEDTEELKSLRSSIGEGPDSSEFTSSSRWAGNLLKYSQQIPPFATQPNTLPSWLSTWAGALSTTFLAIPLGILSLDPHYMTVGNLAFETMKAGVLYAGAYVLIGQDGIWSRALNKMEWIVTAAKERRATRSYRRMSCKQFSY